MTNRLASHIQEQLLSHECAVLPSLGGFVLEATPARFDMIDHLAYPPGVAVHFHEGLTHHDGLLAQSYATRYGISLRRARLMVDDDIRQLRQELVKSGSYTLAGIGAMTLSEDGHIVFEEHLSTPLNSASYGFTAVSMPKLSSPILDDTCTITEPSLVDRQGEEHKYLHLRIPRKLINYTAAAIIVLAALLPWGGHLRDDLSNEVERPFTASFAPDKESMQRILSSVGIETTDIKATANNSTASPTKTDHGAPATQEDQDNASTEVTELLATPTVGQYYVIIATEHDPKLILSHYNRALQEEFPNLQILSGRRVYRVSAGAFATSREAYRYIQHLPEAFSQAWVYKHV